MLAISGGHLDIVEKWLQMEKDPSCLVPCSCADLNKVCHFTDRLCVHG